MNAEYNDILILKNQLWERGLQNFKGKVTSSDPLGMINELFKPGIIGNEMKKASLKLMNSIKSHMFVPSNMQLANITTIFKNKGSRLDMSSDRGIFILPVLRKYWIN